MPPRRRPPLRKWPLPKHVPVEFRGRKVGYVGDVLATGFRIGSETVRADAERRLISTPAEGQGWAKETSAPRGDTYTRHTPSALVAKPLAP